jgi:hypothetical protein
VANRKEHSEKESVAEDSAVKSNEPTKKSKSGKISFRVADGKSIISKRGILAEGDEINANDLAGGKEALDAFVKSGHVVNS